MPWKVALYDFIHACNQMDTDYDWRPLSQVAADEGFLYRTRVLQERRRRQHRERGLAPIRSETRLMVRRIETAGEETQVSVRLHKQLEARVRGAARITEEAAEVWRITLRDRGGGRYIVAAVAELPAAIQHEGAGEAPSSPDAAAAPDLVLPAPPYLSPGNPSLAADRKKGAGYNRERVRRYAEQYWDSSNPAFIYFDVDCSNYVSQCLLAGGHVMQDTGRREAGWWYRGRSGSRELWSYSWAVANSLRIYLGGKRSYGLRAEAVDAPNQLAIGDVISYSWEGNGHFGHSSIVTGFDPDGMPRVNAHTINCRNRYWDYSDSYAWTERTQYRFFHIMEP